MLVKPSNKQQPNQQDRIGKFVLAGWALVAVVGIAALSVRHLASLPEPDNEVLLSRSLLALRHASQSNFLVHVIYGQCSCSKSLLGHLLERRPFPGTEELILFVGSNAEKRRAAEQAGFEFKNISDTELISHFGLEAAPVLVVFDAKRELRYAGGYYDNPATIAPLDVRIHANLAEGKSVEPLPVFGCAVSARLQKSLDPLKALFAK